MFENLVDIHEKLSALERQLSDPDLLNNRTKYQETVREHSRCLAKRALAAYTKVGQDLAENASLSMMRIMIPNWRNWQKGNLKS